MNIIAQHVSPEELMAFLDGELSAGDAKAVSTHVEECAECAKVAEQLRRTSQALSAWKVPAIPAKVEDSIAALAAKAGSGVEIRKPKFYVRPSFWGWKQWTGLSAGAVSALLLVAGLFLPGERAHQAASVATSYDIQLSQGSAGKQAEHGLATVSGAGGNHDKLQSKNEGIVGGVVGGTMGGALGGIVGSNATPSVQVRNGQPAVAQAQLTSPMIARTMSLSIMTKDFARSRASLDSILAHYQGYSAQMNVSTTENAPRNLQASLRIPAPALAAAINDLRSLGRVERESQSGEDVTRQHSDLVARLKNSRDTEQRLRDILQRRTGKLSDVLEVEQEISRVRGEIEEMESEQKALEHRVDFSGVELQLTEEYKAQLNPPAPSVSTRIHNAFVAGYRNASETLLGILLFFAENVPTLLIWLAILAGPVVLIWRRYRRMSAVA
jgi:anti-sigma factor ChrR (cupin superfamily)